MDSRIKAKLEKSWAPIFYKYVFCNIDEKPFSVLYSDTGRANFPVNILLSLEYIKHLKNYSDDELIENFNFNYLINYAVGIRTLGGMNLSEKTLYDFRTRIYKYLIKHPEQEDLIFGQFLNLTMIFAKEAGICMKEQRIDSTMFMSNIKKAGRVALAFDVLYRAVKSIPEDRLSENLKKVLNPEFRTEVIHKTKPSEGESRLEMLLNLCQETKETIENISELKNSDAYRILERFLSEQAYYDEQTKKLKAKDSKSIPSDSLQSAYDEDATYRKKGNKAESGYVLNLSETCAKENSFQLITDYTVEKNIKSDVELLKERLPIIKQNTKCQEVYVDGGYYSKEVVQIAKENCVEVHFTDLNGRKPVRMSVSEYEIDEETKVIKKCPRGIIPIHASVKKGQTVAHFPKEACAKCELKNQCYCKEQKKDYVVRVNLKSIEAAKQREKIECRCEGNKSKRAAIEGTNSALKRGHGLSKLRVRGLVKCRVNVGLKVLAQNFKRFARYMLERAKKAIGERQGGSAPVLVQ
ncbi:transposase [Caldicellulosiruptor morganii]|uniref:transposase n=1 Tax=Caldicellulosiruptor morganii TaxID=1387555 RepID=UPI000A9E61E8|nr:transposase [Caldicellulosiruptor morganii]